MVAQMLPLPEKSLLIIVSIPIVVERGQLVRWFGVVRFVMQQVVKVFRN
jgi:hypothetical protein